MADAFPATHAIADNLIVRTPVCIDRVCRCSADPLHMDKQNGTHACANSETLNGLLKTELNFQGMVVSDYGGASGIACPSTKVYG